MPYPQSPMLGAPQQPGLDQWLMQQMQQMQQPQPTLGGQQQPSQTPLPQQGIGQSLFGAGQRMLGFGQPAQGQGSQQPGQPLQILPQDQQQASYPQGQSPQSPNGYTQQRPMGMGQTLFGMF